MKILKISILEKLLKEIDIEELLVKIEDELDKNIIIESIKENENIYIFIRNTTKETNSLIDFIEEWKIIKKLWIKFKIFDNNNYKQFFSMVEISNNKNNENQIEDLDKFITKVPKNDPKIVDILNQIKKKKK